LGLWARWYWEIYIARTVAYSLAKVDQLGAGFYFFIFFNLFFFQKERSRNGTAQNFPAIANQLIATIPTFKTCLRKSLKRLGNAEVENKVSGTTVQDPYPVHSPTYSPGTSGILTKIIVIDALDECERYGDICRICSLLSQLQ
jgi:hypothetical protein